MSRSKVSVYYKDGSRTTIRCESSLISHYIRQYINKDSVRKLTSQIYPFKNNPQVVHKDVESEVSK